MRTVTIMRYSRNPYNEAAARALVPHYRVGEAYVFRHSFGVLSVLETESTVQSIFDDLVAANIGDSFVVTEVNERMQPIAVLPYVHGEIVPAIESVSPEAELDGLLGRMREVGREGMTPAELVRLRELSESL